MTEIVAKPTVQRPRCYHAYPESPRIEAGPLMRRGRLDGTDRLQRCGSGQPSVLDTLDPADAAVLRQHRFDEDTFMRLKAGLAGGRWEQGANAIDGKVAPPGPGVVRPWPTGEEAQRLRALGTQALERGDVACLVLNGGMATRFGGVVKGVVPVLRGHSFLNLKLEDIAMAPGKSPVFLMNSFATEADTRRHLAGFAALPLHFVNQNISLRLTPEGEIFTGADGRASLYAPGHGDVFQALQRSPEFLAWVERGGKAVMVSNVDNLAATLDPLVVGAFLEGQKDALVEVAPKWKGDAGGAPAEVNGRVEIVEGFRFPKHFDQDSIPVFNTNTMWFDARVFARELPLQWFRADKKVDGEPVVQFERLMGQATANLESAYLEVPREGPDGRFMPVKEPKDLDTLRPAIAARLGRVA